MIDERITKWSDKGIMDWFEERDENLVQNVKHFINGSMEPIQLQDGETYRLIVPGIKEPFFTKKVNISRMDGWHKYYFEWMDPEPRDPAKPSGDKEPIEYTVEIVPE